MLSGSRPQDEVVLERGKHAVALYKGFGNSGSGGHSHINCFKTMTRSMSSPEQLIDERVPFLSTLTRAGTELEQIQKVGGV